MIKNNFNDFSDVRVLFFLLLDTLIYNKYEFIFKLVKNSKNTEHDFDPIVHALIWGIRHSEMNISALISHTFLIFLCLLKKNKIEKWFYTKFKNILNDLIFIMTDKLHFSNYKIHCKILSFFLKNSKIYIDATNLTNQLIIILYESCPLVDKKYLENFVNIYLIETSENFIIEEFKKILKMNRLNYEETLLSEEESI
jgi:hypothetical protein